MKHILNKIRWFFNTFMLSMKKADIEILSQNSDASNIDSRIYQEVNDNRVAQHLLKGEVTQEVVELRYRDYRVAEESKNFKYHGGDKGIKVNQSKNCNNFTVINRDISLSILDSISFDKKYHNFHCITIEYTDIPRFKLESKCETMDVDVLKKTVKLHLNKFTNVYNQDKPLVNELKKLASKTFDFQRHEFSNLQKIYFISRDIKGLKDYLRFSFNDLKLNDVEETDSEYILLYLFQNYEVVDLTEKFYSSEMDKKYSNNEPKKQYSEFDDRKELEKCEICGQPIFEKLETEFVEIYTKKNVCHNCLWKMIQENS